MINMIRKPHTQCVRYDDAGMADDNSAVSLFANGFQIKFHTNDEHKKYKAYLADKTKR